MARIWNKPRIAEQGSLRSRHKQINPHTKNFGVGVNTPLKRKVFIALSGGVDSSVAAFLLKERGYDVSGVFMRCFNLDGCAEQDAEDARRVASRLDIPFSVFDFEAEYKKKVAQYMIDGYGRGITPNPDVMCNKEIKFGLFLKKARVLGAQYIATGHYVTRKGSESEGWSLETAKDSAKDQSYFLWMLTQGELRHCLFPIGAYLKSEVRDIARRAGLHTAEKKDSQGICFLGKISLRNFLRRRLPLQRGDVRDVEGRKIGEHDGAWFYTIGQRHGLHLETKQKILLTKERHAVKPHYVAGKNVKTNTLVVAEGDDHPALYKKEVRLQGVNIINPEIVLPQKTRKAPLALFCRIRYRGALAKAVLSKAARGYKLVFKKPQKFAAPGQSAVFYSKSRSDSAVQALKSLQARREESSDSKRGMLLGGGVIC